MPITNALISLIKNRQLKEVLETSLYLNSNEDSQGEVRSQGSAAAASDSSVSDLIIGQKIEEAVQAALQTYRRSAVVQENGRVCISKQCLEDLYYLSFIDLTSVKPR